MKYYLLCSGSKGNCFVLVSKSTKIVIDCGSTKHYLCEKFSEININIDDIDALLLTHNHSDHISQIKLFANVQTYAPFDLACATKIVPKQEIEIKGLKILPIALSHDTDICVGYIFEDENERLVYITDTGYLKESYFDLIRNADYYIIESNHNINMLMQTSRPYITKMRILSDCGHLSNETCSEILKEVVGEKTKEVVLAHISEEANELDLAYSVNKEALKDRNIEIKLGLQRAVVDGGTL